MLHRRDYSVDLGPVLSVEQVDGFVPGQPQQVKGQRPDVDPQPTGIQCAGRFRLIGPRERWPLIGTA